MLSSIVDNVPLVAGCIGMYPLQEAGAFAVDGVFWQLLAYCAGVGGSILIIGSAAGVVAMGLEKISFGWYARHISWAALIGYLAGIVSYYQVVVAMEGMVEALSHDRQHAHLLQAGHRHQDAEEEEDGAHIDSAQQLHSDRIIYASLIILAANAGGAFSPIGDVTTIMLWNKGLITAAGVISEILLPSLVSMIIPAFILQYQLKGELMPVKDNGEGEENESDFSEAQRKVVFWVGVGGLLFVPVFKSITHLPPFVGILLVLGTLWTVTEVFYRNLHRAKNRTPAQ